MASNPDQTHQTISRWQLLELIGLAHEAGLAGTQIRQILASEYGVNPDYTSRVLVDLVKKGYVLSLPAPAQDGAKGGRPRKVYIRTDKANDLPDKPIPRETALAAPPAQEPPAAHPALPLEEIVQANIPATPPTPAEHPVTEAAPLPQPEMATGPDTKRRRGSRRPIAPITVEEAQVDVSVTPPTPAERPVTEAAPLPPPETSADSGAPRRRIDRRPRAPAGLHEATSQQELPITMTETVVEREAVTELPLDTSPQPATAPAMPSGAEASPIPSAPATPEPARPVAAPSPDTVSLEATPAPTSVHETLAAAMDQFSDLLLLQVAHKLGAFVAHQMAPLERATGELCAQIDGLRARLDSLSQHIGNLATAPMPPLSDARPLPTEPATPTHVAVSRAENTGPAGPRPSNMPGSVHPKNNKKAPQTLTEQLAGLRSAPAGQRKVKALLIGVPADQEQLIRERFGGRYGLMFLGADAKFGKVRAIRDQYEVVLGLEDTCSPGVRDALKGHPHKAILPRPSQLMDELEEYFQLYLEQSPAGSAS